MYQIQEPAEETGSEQQESRGSPQVATTDEPNGAAVLSRIVQRMPPIRP